MRTFDWDGNETELPDNWRGRGPASLHALCLWTAYAAVTHIHAALMDAFAAGQASDQATLLALANRLFQDFQSTRGLEWLRNTDVRKGLRVTLTAADLAGKCADVSPGSRYAKYMEVRVSHIMSLDTPPVDLGAVALGDTFIDAPPAIAKEPAPYLVLTAKIPRVTGWMCSRDESGFFLPKFQVMCCPICDLTMDLTVCHHNVSLHRHRVHAQPAIAAPGLRQKPSFFDGRNDSQ
jgi:hypothetical protein